jgi:cytochrome c-type biogenesis protein CcmH
LPAIPWFDLAQLPPRLGVIYAFGRGGFPPRHGDWAGLMILWLVFALMTAAAVFAVLWPLSRRAPVAGGASEIAVYRDQLDEIVRDRNAGLIGPAEAQAARVEVSRRLIAAADAAVTAPSSGGSPLWRRRAIALAALVLLPIGAGALYLLLGQPQLPGEPLSARLAEIHRNSPIEELVAQAELRLARNPSDVRGYEVLAPVYLQLGRFADAVNACRKIIALAGENAERQADLGVALTAAAGGLVTAEAKAAFARALALDPQELKAEFFSGLAAKQDGNKARAAAIWRDMLAQVPAQGSWATNLREALADLGAPFAVAANAGKNDVAAAAQMRDQDQNAMIRGMVARLAGRLKQNGNDADGWQRLLRAYMVLGERSKAVAAAADARKALAGDPDRLRRVENTIKSLGIEG